ncbi:S-methyl-5-thioribose-1-phosphate isomerase [Nonomuraea cavernae]|uniref:Methylthioribose-1-phosphate isomerase n=1 Tax=Nonomuraea cavernae TaxID=2045107 RepID=A0A917ZBJ3_9ACTN|nr:S-methyl-5-thioribose-1-phosphate isomerase [Nonomuraea cavernae]MCA2186665.1 S-methyl-5-thioribose-1-phosphate isomerase [Nonomuraea cavernae]GGO79778.1 methylthioribose-1-phosphate isomerase [Nonomuraea cavernae]
MDRSITWDDGAIVAVDQRALPHAYRTLRITGTGQLIEAIQELAIRGAPALGVAGALGVALIARTAPDHRTATEEAERLAGARPTAVNLARGVHGALGLLGRGPDAVLAHALDLLADDERINREASARAADLVLRLCERRPLRLLTHCNTGRLATVAWGTALGTIRTLAEAGHVGEVLAGETRPLLQGARLTTWELAEAGIPYRLCADSAGPFAIGSGLVDCVLVGADRVAANGDVANKIGTYALAVAAARQRIPFIVVAPESTVDESTPDGARIVIEERGADEVTSFGGRSTATPGSAVYNPAFDVTPADLVTAVVTETRVLS